MNEIRAKPFLIECAKFFMSEMNPRHKYGTFALILAVLAFLLSIFSTGATWATVDDKSTVIEDESFFDNLTIEVALQGDLQLTEMDSEVEVTIFFEGSDEPIEEQSFRESESYEELAEKSTGDMRDTFEEMDTAGTVAQWMIWLGIIAMLLTAVFAFCSLAQITNSRFTTYSGSAATFLLFFAILYFFAVLDTSIPHCILMLLALSIESSSYITIWRSRHTHCSLRHISFIYNSNIYFLEKLYIKLDNSNTYYLFAHTINYNT